MESRGVDEGWQTEDGRGLARTLAGGLLLALAVVAGLALLLVWGSQSGEGQGLQPDYSVSMEQGENILDPCHNITSVRNAVIIENPDPDYKEINVTIDIGGAFSVEPSQFTVTVGPGESVRTEINISVLPNSSLQQQTANVRTKIVRWNGLPYNDPVGRSSGFTAMVLACANIDFTTSTYQIMGRAGDNLTLGFALVNRGNSLNDFTINVTGLPSGWSVESPDNFSLQNVPSQERVNFTLYLRADSHATARLNVTATSVIEGARGDSASLYITVEVKRSWGEILAGGVILTAALGSAAAYVAGRRREKSQAR